jgi:hypothetical protein
MLLRMSPRTWFSSLFLTALLGCVALASAPGVATAQPQAATVSGYVYDQYDMGIPGATVSTTDASGNGYSVVTGAGGSFTLASLPASDTQLVTYTLSVSPPAGYSPTTYSVQVSAGQDASSQYIIVQAQDGAVAGVVDDQNGDPLYGMQVQLSPDQTAITGPDGQYEISGLLPGSYTLTVIDGHTPLTEGTLSVTGATVTQDVTLPAPAVPAGTVAHQSARDLGYLNAERRADGLPSGIRLNTRWSIECAAHDYYLLENHLLQHTESASQPGYSAGGAWAGTSAVLSEGAPWTPGSNPWENAPIHLNQLFAPSLSVIGIDESHSYVAATTFVGMLRAPVNHDTIFTYPGNGEREVPATEVANERPFTPQQFVGIKYGRTTGRQMFVYLNTAHTVGQAPVTILAASMKSASGEREPLRWVNTTTKTVGPYLSGAVLIPVTPLSDGTTYSVSVKVKDGKGTLAHTWSFATAGKAP